MPEDATRGTRGPGTIRLVAWIAVGAAALGVFSTWTTVGAVTVNGIEGPSDGWLVVLAAAFALAWTGSLARGSWAGIAAVLGAAVVIGWTAVGDWLDGRHVGADVGWGLLVALAASVVLGGAAVARALDRAASAGVRGSGRVRASSTREGS